ncbi:putative anterior fat body protein [Tricladium varicosporioides]|nr:putative anterior fat body protein [Hymenoscyphus varicosporioides]
MATALQPIKPFHAPQTHPKSWGGEAPIYRSRDNTLHWVDPLSSPPELHILSLNPSTLLPDGPARVLKLEDSVTVMCFRKGFEGSYICAYTHGVGYLDEETGKLEVAREIIGVEERGLRRFNDGGVDAKGRFWLAEIDLKAVRYGLGGLPADYGSPKGRLWRYDPDGSAHCMDEGVICGNGIGWSPDNKTMYFNDSLGQKTFRYDFDLETGSISNKSLFLDFNGTIHEQDGLVIDSKGNIWTAIYNGSSIMVFSHVAQKIKEIPFSAKKMTCPTWGGPNNDILFATSAILSNEEGDEGGCLFKYQEEGVKGLVKNEFSG